ncbi:MAG TPA: tetratricopeptide repeat protein [Hyphomicrobiaceae bacterium]|nr:tetratricopeptide repeat protein [Hyphomicrobiaceae bacterium]
MRLLGRQFDDARSTAEKVLQQDPSNVRALVLRANAIAGLKNPNDAVKDLEEAIKLDPTGSELYTNLGGIELQRNRLADAEAAFKKAAAIAPTSVAAQLALGHFYLSTNRLAEAEQAFKRATELEPLDSIANRSLAIFYLATRRRADAEAPLQALAKTDKGVQARLTLADYYLLGGKTEQGTRILTALASEREGKVPATVRLAAIQYNAGKRAEAHQMIDGLLAADARNAQVLIAKAKFLLGEGRSDEALARAKDAVAADSNSVPAFYLIGKIELAKQHHAEASEAFTQVLRLNPRAVMAQLELSRLKLAGGDVAGAVQSAELAVRNAPNAKDARLALARSLLARGDATRAAVELKALDGKYSGDPAVIAMTGDLHLTRKDYGKAKSAYELAYQRDPTSLEALAGLIALDLLAGKPSDAHAKMDAHLAKPPLKAAALILAATTYAATRDQKRAEAVLRKAIEIDPANLQAYTMLGRWYYAQGRIAEGRTEFENLTKREPTSVPANTMLGIILERQGHADEAKARYEKVLAIDPRAAVAANNLAWIYANSGENLDVALQLAQSASTQLPDRSEVADTLGWVYQKKGLPKFAVPILQGVVKKDPQNPQYRYHLGVALASAGDSAGAKTELQKALALNASFPEAADARRVLATVQ